MSYAKVNSDGFVMFFEEIRKRSQRCLPSMNDSPRPGKLPISYHKKVAILISNVSKQMTAEHIIELLANNQDTYGTKELPPTE